MHLSYCRLKATLAATVAYMLLINSCSNRACVVDPSKLLCVLDRQLHAIWDTCSLHIGSLLDRSDSLQTLSGPLGPTVSACCPLSPRSVMQQAYPLDDCSSGQAADRLKHAGLWVCGAPVQAVKAADCA